MTRLRHSEEHTSTYTLAISTYKREQTKIKGMIHSALNVSKKPTMTLDNLREKVGNRLKNRKLSDVLVEMRQQGY